MQELYRPENEHPSILKKLSLFFIILVIIVFLLIAYFFLGKAEITVAPTIKPVSVTFNVSIKDTTEGEDIVIKGNTFAEEIAAKKSFQVSEQTHEEPGLAKGEVTIVNNNSSEQTLVATTRFLTPDNVLFRLDRKVVIPRNSKITATLTADKAGAAGDIQSPTKLTIPGLSEALQARIFGQVEKSFSGGIKKSGTLKQEDIDAARKALNEKIIEDTKLNYLANFLQERSSTNPIKTPDIYTQINIMQESTSHNLGDLVNEFELSLTGDLKGVVFNKDEINMLSRDKLISSLGSGEKFISIEPGSLDIKVKEVDITNNQAFLEVSIAGQSIFTPGGDVIDKKELTGKTMSELTDYFANMPGVEKIEVKFSPFWVSRVPNIKKNVNIIIEE